MMNAIGGTSLHYWAQHWRLNPWDFKVVSETKRRYGASRHSEGLDGRGLAVRLRRDRAVLRQDRIRARRVGSGRQHQRQDRSARQSVRGAAQARVPDAAAALDGVPRKDGGGRQAARLASVPGPGRDQLAAATRTDRAACTTASATPAAATSMRRTRPRSRRFRAHRRPASSRRSPAPSSRRSTSTRRGARAASPIVSNGEEFFQPAKVVLLAELRVRELPAAAAVEVEGVSQRSVEQSRSGGKTLLQPSPGRAGHGAVPVQHRRVVRPSGAGCRGRRLGPTTTSITRRTTSSAAAICGRCRIGVRSPRPA